MAKIALIGVDQCIGDTLGPGNTGKPKDEIACRPAMA